MNWVLPPVLLANAMSIYAVAGIVAIALVVAVIVIIRSYKRCPENKIMVIFGKIPGDRPIIIQEGGAFVKPIFQDFEFISLEPFSIELDMGLFLRDLDAKATPAAVFTARVSTKPDIIDNAVERLLGLPIAEISSTLEDVIAGQMRLQIGDKTAAYINSNRLQLVEDILTGANLELVKIGIEIIEADIPQLVARK